MGSRGTQAQGGVNGGNSSFGSGVRNNFQVSISGILPMNMEANSEKEVVRLFNEANATSTGIGYKITRKVDSMNYEIAQTFNGRLVPNSVQRRRRVYLYQEANGKWSFGD